MPSYTALRKQRSRQRLRRKIRQILVASGCVDCGVKHPDVLDFDHVRGKKHAAVSYLVSKLAAWTRIVVEVAKCEVRCSNCHRIITARRRRATQ